LIVAILGAFAFGCNSYLIYIFLRFEELRYKESNIFIVGQLVGDLFRGIVALFNVLAFYYLENSSFCFLNAVFWSSTTVLSAFTVLGITYSRKRAILDEKPLSYEGATKIVVGYYILLILLYTGIAFDTELESDSQLGCITSFVKDYGFIIDIGTMGIPLVCIFTYMFVWRKLFYLQQLNRVYNSTINHPYSLSDIAFERKINKVMFITIVLCTVNCILGVVMMIVRERMGNEGKATSQNILIVLTPFVVKLGQAICDPVLYAFNHPTVRSRTIFAYPYSRIKGTTESLQSSSSRLHSSILFKKSKASSNPNSNVIIEREGSHDQIPTVPSWISEIEDSTERIQ